MSSIDNPKITANEVRWIRKALKTRNTQLIPTRFKSFDDPWAFLFLKLLTLYSDDRARKPTKQSAKTTSYDHAIELALLAFTKSPRKGPLKRAIYKRLLEDTLLALSTGLSRGAFESLPANLKPAALSGEFADLFAEDPENDGFQPWDPLTDPDFGR